ncbi:ATP-binding protein [Flaviramulus sp. BrNp1-15]|uniref:hybrid sensor histidine kinase/response regulator transcription factor n=1 Tax=Flaviramulus sp. BrNp1-15 TaxID=2916754 RepID=UPI001EE8EE79|nr:hybrid sensor histidine kinase/response regulator transcription factor [Flaviramulus sp. BrNp1-15]ULC60361.1 ATP-binding protein [Flaviramulus sp. BrNp1-15]
MLKNKIHLLYFFFVGTLFCFSQSQTTFKKINQSTGLSNGRITSIVKEKDGFIWIGTKNGLNRYDGLQVKVYNKKNSNLGSNDISDLFIDSKNRLWITTLGGGVNYYNPLNDTFRVFKNNPNDSKSLLSNHVNTVIEDSKGGIWFGTEKGLCKFNTDTNQFISYTEQPTENQSTNSNSITCIYEDKNGNLWVGTFGNGLFLFDATEGKFNQIIPKETQISAFINAISELNPDKILIGTSGSGLLLVDISTFKFSNFFKEDLSFKQDINIVRSIKKDSRDNLWIGTDGNGVFEIEYPNAKSPIIHNYLYNSQLESSLSGNAIYEIMDDNDSNIWIGTAWNGISILDKKNTNEILFSDIIGVNPTPVLSIYKNKKNLYLGLDGDGLTVYNQQLDKVKYYNEKSKNTSIKAKFIQKITESKSGDIWLGTFANGLIKFNESSNTFKQYKHEFENEKSISYDDVRDIVEDENNNLWVATWGGGLNYFNPKKDEFYSYRNSTNETNTVNNDNLIAIEKDGENLWIATFGGGVNLFNTKTKRFTYFTHSESDSTSISGNNVFSLLKDFKGYLWIGTSGEGINRMNLKTKEIERFENNDNIRYLTITGIIEDNDGNIWFSTKQGIINYTYQTNTFNTFANLSGEFHINSIFKDDNGLLYFGGINGVVKVNPKTVTIENNQPTVKLTNFKLFNKEIKAEEKGVLNNNIAFEEDITLKHNQDVLTFEFSALQFPFSSNCEYAIKMENFDEDWRNIGKDRTATYTNLSPGDYTFKVKSKELGSTWGDDYTSVNIHILKPFWLKWWAFVLYGIILLTLFYLFRKYTIAWERMKANLEFEKLTHEKDTELYNLKQQFFTNISHEIRTPVTLILSSINRLFDKGELLERKQIKAAHTVRKNSNLLLQLVNELLDIRKFETNEINLKPSKNELVSYCKEIFLSFSEIASDRNIDYTFVSEKPNIDLWFDKNQLEKVIYNLLTNAFKFTKNGGEIQFKIEHKADAVYLIVKDSGVGMSENQISKIFKRFYQAGNKDTNEESGFGLGLSISKEIIELHKGSISVESEKGKGSTFRVKLLNGKEHFSDNVIDNINDLAEEEIQVITNAEKLKLTKEAKKETILIVEDNVDIQGFLKDILSDNFEILQAFNGAEGLKIATSKFPDLIISDVMMPIMDGIEFAKKLKLNTNTSHIPIIILTARTSIKNKMEGFETGADEYVTKPFNEELLKTRINNLLNSRKLLREKFRNENMLTPKELAISSTDQLFLDKLYKAIEANLETNNLKAEDISKEIGMSHSVMYKKIKALTGLSYVEFIREYRLAIARQLIEDLGYSVSDACFKVGYSDRKYFSKLFKQKFNKNPSEFLSKK